MPAWSTKKLLIVGAELALLALWSGVAALAHRTMAEQDALDRARAASVAPPAPAAAASAAPRA